jgi:hypothetical protein
MATRAFFLCYNLLRGANAMNHFRVALALFLSGCAASTGILPAGPDTYTVTERFAPIRGGSTTAQQTALSEANAYCGGQNKQFLALDMQTLPSSNPYEQSVIR